MTLSERLPHWFRPAAYLSHNAFTMVGAVLAISSAFTVIGFWIYDFTTGGTINPYIGLIFILILPGIFVVGLAMLPIGRSLASPQTKSRRQASGRIPQGGFQPAVFSPDRGLGGRLHGLQCHHPQRGLLSKRRVHGFGEFLRANLPHGHAAGIHRLPELSSSARQLRAMPHRAWSGLVRAVETFRRAAGSRGHVSHLRPSDSVACRTTAPGSRNLRAVPLAHDVHGRQAHCAKEIFR